MRDDVNGFDLEVTHATPDRNDPTIPSVTVRVKMRNGTTIFDSAAVSINGLRSLGEVFDQAAKLVYDELDMYYYRANQERDRARKRSCERRPEPDICQE